MISIINKIHSGLSISAKEVFKFRLYRMLIEKNNRQDKLDQKLLEAFDRKAASMTHGEHVLRDMVYRYLLGMSDMFENNIKNIADDCHSYTEILKGDMPAPKKYNELNSYIANIKNNFCYQIVAYIIFKAVGELNDVKDFHSVLTPLDQTRFQIRCVNNCIRDILNSKTNLPAGNLVVIPKLEGFCINDNDVEFCKQAIDFYEYDLGKVLNMLLWRYGKDMITIEIEVGNMA